MFRFAVVLAGCGVLDGSEIHEATCALIAIKKYGGEYVCFSLDKPQLHVVNHKTQETIQDETRNILVESARISRGAITPIDDYTPDAYDALIFPGGCGVGENFFTIAIDGADCNINEKIKDMIIKTHKAGKFIGGMCVASGLIARAFKGTNIHPKVTGGCDEDVVNAIKEMGSINKECQATEVCVDETNKIITTPAYLSAQDIYEVFLGAETMIKTIIKALNLK